VGPEARSTTRVTAGELPCGSGGPKDKDQPSWLVVLGLSVLRFNQPLELRPENFLASGDPRRVWWGIQYRLLGRLAFMEMQTLFFGDCGRIVAGGLVYCCRVYTAEGESITS